MRNLFLTIAILLSVNSFAQELNEIFENSLQVSSESACNCADSIEVRNVSKQVIAEKISECIDKQMIMFDLMNQISKMDLGKILSDNLKESKDKNDTIIVNNTNDIYLNTDKNSDEYKKNYFEIERYLMENCKAVKNALGSNDMESNFSYSENAKAIKFYEKGVGFAQNNNHKKAIKLYKKALKIDPVFAFCWDNLGLSYRQTDQIDNAIDAYKNSLKIDPKGAMPLQNIAIAYQYKKQFDKSIASYQKLAAIDDNNPEIYYGIGMIYATELNDYEKALENMCKAYNLYIELKSPYRSDAEKLINFIHTKMEEQNNLDKFNTILEKYNISAN